MAGMQLMAVQVPFGVHPGQTIQIKAPSGQMMAVQVPAGVGPGGTFQVRVPLTQTAWAPTPQPQRQPQYTNTLAAPADPTLRLFQSVDTNRSGSIDQRELQQALSTRGFRRFQAKTARLLIKKHSRTGSTRQLAFPEFVALLQTLENWKAKFSMADAPPKDGRITEREFCGLLGQLGFRFTQPFMVTLFRLHDADKSGFLEFDEFIQIGAELETLTAQFSARDTGRSGRITVGFQEFMEMVFSVQTLSY